MFAWLVCFVKMKELYHILFIYFFILKIHTVAARFKHKRLQVCMNSTFAVKMSCVNLLAIPTMQKFEILLVHKCIMGGAS